MMELKCGDSLLFSLPREYLRWDSDLYVTFTYDWEDDQGTVSPEEPTHRIYFSGDNFPDK